jgi:hypothetical protein
LFLDPTDQDWKDNLVSTIGFARLGAGMESMSKAPSTAPFLLPEKLEPGLARVRAYWEGLKRGAADIPFGDDLNITAMRI